MPAIKRLHLSLTGTVQGVGFRPFVYRLAQEECLAGWVRNVPGGVEIELEGNNAGLAGFLARLDREKPPLAALYGLEPRWLEPCGLTGFDILESTRSGALEPILLPDLATCPACAEELRDPSNRRFGYPFTNCTHCGPRYTIISELPYDREATSMNIFHMCPECRREYDDPADRRFHAQPVSCPACGPSLLLYSHDGRLLSMGRTTTETGPMIASATACLARGGIIALMGLGGVQLLADACNETAVRTLRDRKRRDAKPFAVMTGHTGHIAEIALADDNELGILRSPAAPIVLLRRYNGPSACLAPSVCMTSPWVGTMLPTTPLHHLLLDAWGGMLVATSGNLADEPLCTTPDETLRRLSGIADLFLLHDRPILRPVDDSVVRVWRGRELMLRRARGYAPLPVGRYADSDGPAVLALGGQMKNAVGWQVRGRTILSQHLGDLDSEASLAVFQKEVGDTGNLFRASPDIIAVDSHPDYQASRYGRLLADGEHAELRNVQHHIAHVLACMEENDVRSPALGVAWDGTGYGPDGTVWGGEWFLMGEQSWKRAGFVRPFRMPGGELAVREPNRIALALLSAAGHRQTSLLSCTTTASMERGLAAACRLMMQKSINAPVATSMGRIFDAVAFFLGFEGTVLCEGQAAMQLEAWAWQYPEGSWKDTPPLAWGFHDTDAGTVMDWAPMLASLERGLAKGEPRDRLAWRFHDGLAELIVTHSLRWGMNNICVGGGCFQNALLLELLLLRAERAGLVLYHPQRVPAHDGGLALGQIAAVNRHYPSS